jgi:hypothetical protein
VPTFPYTPDKCKEKRWLSSKNPSCEIDSKVVTNQSQQYFKVNVVKRNPNIRLLETQKYFCDDAVCNMTRGAKVTLSGW